MSTGTEGDPERLHAALLWDLDNMPGPPKQLASLARVLSLSVDDESPLIAGARRGAYRRAHTMLTQMGIEVLSGGRSASGADRCLCDRGRMLRRHGHRAFVVVSNDRFFSCLARLGEVHVITLDVAHLSIRLAAAATTVTALDFDGSFWVRRRVLGTHGEGTMAITDQGSGQQASEPCSLATGDSRRHDLLHDI